MADQLNLITKKLGERVAYCLGLFEWNDNKLRRGSYCCQTTEDIVLVLVAFSMSIHFMYRPSKRKTCEGAPCAISLLVVLCLVSVIALIVDGLLFARPGLIAINYKATTCQVVRYEIVEYRTCKCGGINNDNSPYCKSSFPCLQIYVKYNIHGAAFENSSVTSMIHGDETMGISGNSDCSTQVCKRHKKQNTMEINQFLQRYGESGIRYPCLYNPEQTDEVIIERSNSKIVVIVSLVVPSATFIFSLVFLCLLCRVARKQEKKSQPPPLPQYRGYLNYGMPINSRDNARNNGNTGNNGNNARNNDNNGNNAFAQREGDLPGEKHYRERPQRNTHSL